MNPSDIKPTDWQRILFGNTSPEFLIEVFLRTLVVYLALLLIVKWLGKRMSGQLTIIEMTVMVTLGAIVSVPMQMPDRGILQGLLILLVALGLHHAITYVGLLYPKAENLLQGKPTILIKDGMIQLKEMDEVRITRQQLFSDLRTKKIYQLGKLKRVYLEPGGSISIIEAAEPKPGLSVFPPKDEKIFKGAHTPGEEVWVCVNCGKLSTHNGPDPCGNCQDVDYMKAIE